MNGGMDYPPNYNLAGPLERLLVFVLRRSSGFWNHILPGKRQAVLLLVANDRTRRALPPGLDNKPILELPENGVDTDLFKPRSPSTECGQFRIICVSRLVDWKRIDLLLDACAGLVGKVDFHLDLLGDGPLRGALEDRMQQHLLENRVQFHGRIAHAQTAELLRSADVMVLPSVRECGGAVVLEAMASGIPVIAAKWGGPADYITAETGVLIPPATPEVFVHAMTEAILTLARDQTLKARMGDAGRLRAVALYDWRAKAKKIFQIYQDVLHSTSAN